MVFDLFFYCVTVKTIYKSRGNNPVISLLSCVQATCGLFKSSVIQIILKISAVAIIVPSGVDLMRLTVLCGTKRNEMVLCQMVLCETVLCETVLCGMVLCETVLCEMVLCET